MDDRTTRDDSLRETTPATALACRGLRSAAELARDHAHGSRLKYRAGCRCSDCRRANTQYELARAKARKAGDWNGYVPAARARAHLLALSEAGVGRRQISDASGVAQSILFGIRNGDRPQLRALTERRILAVTPDAAADRALTDAAPSWKLIEELLASGYTKTCLAREMGKQSHALQLRRGKCTVRNAYEVQQMYRRLRRVPAKEALGLIANLREEGFRQPVIANKVSALAASKGLPAPDLKVYRGFISAVAADLLQQLHAQLSEEA